MPRDFYEGVAGTPDVDPYEADVARHSYTILEGIRVSVFARGTTDLVTVYQRETGVSQGPSPEAGATGGPNPFFTGPTGSIQLWCDAPGRYDIQLTDTKTPPRIGTRIIPWNAIALDGVPEASLAQAVLDAFIPIGGELPYAGDSDPPGGRFLLAEGRFVLIADYPLAFARWGHKYNRDASGNPVDPGGGLFKIPDKRGRGSIGADNMGTAQGSAGNLPSLLAVQRVIGSKIGADQVVLTPAQLPAHAHPDNIAYTAAGGHGHTTGGSGTLNHTHAVYDPGHGHNISGGVPIYNTAYAGAGQPVVAGGSNIGLPRQALGADGSGVGIGIYMSMDTGYNLDHGHTVNPVGDHSHTKSGGVQNNVGGGGSHSNLEPNEVDNWIVRMK